MAVIPALGRLKQEDGELKKIEKKKKENRT
jgi:hypothetical protein